MPNVTNFGDISPRTAAFAVKRLLARGQFDMVIERFGQKDPQPKKNSLTRKFRRYLPFARAKAPLAEGVTPKAQKLQKEDVIITLQQYGSIAETTDVVADTHEDPVLAEMMDISGEQAAETVESIRIDALAGGSNVFYANGVASRATVNSPPTRGDFRKIKRFFRRSKAKTIGKIIKASPSVATEPVAPSYFVLGHTDIEADLMAIPGFVPVEKYSDADKAMPYEVGKLEGFRFLLTAMFDPFLAAGTSGTTYLSNGAEVSAAAKADVYPMFVIARDSYAIVPLQGSDSMDISVLNPGKKTKSDPLGQRGMVSWKTYQGAGILNQAWFVRLEVAVTADPQ